MQISLSRCLKFLILDLYTLVAEIGPLGEADGEKPIEVKIR